MKRERYLYRYTQDRVSHRTGKRDKHIQNPDQPSASSADGAGDSGQYLYGDGGRLQREAVNWREAEIAGKTMAALTETSRGKR